MRISDLYALYNIEPTVILESQEPRVFYSDRWFGTAVQKEGKLIMPCLVRMEPRDAAEEEFTEYAPILMPLEGNWTLQALQELVDEKQYYANTHNTLGVYWSATAEEEFVLCSGCTPTLFLSVDLVALPTSFASSTKYGACEICKEGIDKALEISWRCTPKGILQHHIDSVAYRQKRGYFDELVRAQGLKTVESTNFIAAFSKWLRRVYVGAKRYDNNGIWVELLEIVPLTEEESLIAERCARYMLDDKEYGKEL